MFYNRLLRRIESRAEALNLTALYNYFYYAEQRSSKTNFLFQAMGIVAWLGATLTGRQNNSLSMNSIIGYTIGMTGCMLLALGHNPPLLRVGLKLIFLAFLTHALRSLMQTSDNNLFWALSVSALIVVVISPLFNDPFSFSACAGMIMVTLLGPYAQRLLGSHEINWIVCLTGTALIFGLTINVMFFQQGFRIYNANRKLVQMAYTDSLTGINNRRSFLQCVGDMMEGREMSNHLFLLLIDVDNFKAVNDCYGHEKGDKVLIELAKRLQEVTSIGHCGRLGGEEFAAVLSGSAIQAKALAGEINRKISANEIDGLSVTVSIGLAELCDDMSISELLAEADKQLYVAKRNGKNCYSVADQIGRPSTLAHSLSDDSLRILSTSLLKS